MPTSITSSYALPAILLNPVIILHSINTVASYIVPSNLPPANSPHPFIEQFGPVSGSKPYFDMHDNNQMCWSYTAIMIVIQLFAFGKVKGNRIQRRRAKDARLESEGVEEEAVEEKSIPAVQTEVKTNGQVGGLDSSLYSRTNGVTKGYSKGNRTSQCLEQDDDSGIDLHDSSDCNTETSEEETIV